MPEPAQPTLATRDLEALQRLADKYAGPDLDGGYGPGIELRVGETVAPLLAALLDRIAKLARQDCLLDAIQSGYWRAIQTSSGCDLCRVHGKPGTKAEFIHHGDPWFAYACRAHAATLSLSRSGTTGRVEEPRV